MDRYLSAREAAESLGITAATLYAYTSRGLLRSEAVPGKPRERRYARDAVERLKERKEARRDPARAAARALNWGTPVLSSGITLIQDGRPYYRGRDVVRMAEIATLEETACWLWGMDEGGEGRRLFEEHRPIPRVAGLSKDPIVRMQAALAVAGEADRSAHDLRPAAAARAGARILRLFATIVAGREFRGSIHEALHAAWAPRDKAAAEAIRAALVLCADHELNVSAFTVRCAASAGASAYDAIAAGIAAVKGARHGGETGRVAALFAEAGRPGVARKAVAERLRRGERLPGFGHPLYPHGDPRSELLMRLAERGADAGQRRLARAIASAAWEAIQERPNVDFGLVALARTFGWPANAPLVLFALGRTAGWIAHVMEQYGSEELIRPRANYVGPAPETD